MFFYAVSSVCFVLNITLQDELFPLIISRQFKLPREEIKQPQKRTDFLFLYLKKKKSSRVIALRCSH